ncbi:SSL2 DNA or RNA helicases of superfamily II [uncultured Caudovirales phage]|uniref:SSL2 DNA or RNA helicases of superfamily II n=1 Tax=uncultured Caudovirales phage TaxID=2100421 RepID=A0A6J7WZB1_9CAUD|nr:SSL2 DNA or RNA helicases of superfamily II [uncultured Caudovirales phage]
MHLRKINEVHMKVEAEPSVIQELSDHLTFDVPGAKFMPAVRNKFWDGKIRLLNALTGVTYAGLKEEIVSFCKPRDYEITFDVAFKPTYTIDDQLVADFIKKLNPKMEPRDYQLEAFKYAVNNDRAVFLSPTASGKSFIIYLIARYYNVRTLIIVPTTSLVSQLYTDFSDYGFSSDLHVHRIYGGQDKFTDKPITISTWQSLYKLPKEYFKSFELIIGDEAHQFKAKSLMTIMDKMENTKFRFGFTGTLDGSLTNKITLEGLFGPVNQVTTTKMLMDLKVVADLKLKVLILKYTKEDCKIAKKFDYQKEMDFIVTHSARNKLIKKLATSLHGNTLLLFQYVDKHGRMLYDMIKSDDPERKVYFIHGGVDAEDREAVRAIVERERGAIIVASYGTFSTGVNIRNLHNVVFASPTKSRIRTLQSIGRGLRISGSKDTVTIYDIADDMRIGTHTNFTIQHLAERLQIYNSENFDYKIYNMELSNGESPS